MRKVVVTEGAGFAGRNLVNALLDDGYEVHVVDNPAPYTGAKDPAAGWPLFDPRSYSNFIFAHRTTGPGLRACATPILIMPSTWPRWWAEG